MKILYFAKLRQSLGKSEETVCIEKKKKISQVISELKKRNEVYNFADEGEKKEPKILGKLVGRKILELSKGKYIKKR